MAKKWAMDALSDNLPNTPEKKKPLSLFRKLIALTFRKVNVKSGTSIKNWANNVQQKILSRSCHAKLCSSHNVQRSHVISAESILQNSKTVTQDMIQLERTKRLRNALSLRRFLESGLGARAPLPNSGW